MGIPKEGYELIHKCLKHNSKDRPSMREVLSTPWLWEGLAFASQASAEIAHYKELRKL